MAASGVREKPKPYTKPKHPQEARALFGVALKDGEGIRMPMFDYTDKKVKMYVNNLYVLLSNSNHVHSGHWSGEV